MCDHTVLSLTKPFSAEVGAYLDHDVHHASDNKAFLYDSNDHIYPLGPCGTPANRILHLKHRGCVLKTLRLPASFPDNETRVNVDKSDDLYVYGGIQFFEKIDLLGASYWTMFRVEPPRPWPEETTEAYATYRNDLRQAVANLRAVYGKLRGLMNHNPLAPREVADEVNRAADRLTRFESITRPSKRPRTDDEDKK